MSAYDPLQWHDFFVGTIGASAALTGLLFVTISINLEQILKFPFLPGRAAGTLGLLVAALVVSGFALAPGQSNRALGLETAAVGVAIVVQSLWVSLRRRGGERNTRVPQHLIPLLLPGLAFIAGGLSLVAGGGGGFYWVLAAVLLAFVVASINAWVLLVEILR
jgi:modulator of FtsH protease